MTRRKEAAVKVAASPDAVLARLHDQTRLAEHTGRPSLMMRGGRMTCRFGAQSGPTAGSHIRMGGNAFGLKLELDEVITGQDPPRCKLWRRSESHG